MNWLNSFSRTCRAACGLAALMLLVVSTQSARALINPHYTPVDLYYQSPRILRVQIGLPNDRAEMELTVVKMLKGTPPKKISLRADLTDVELGKNLKAAFGGRRKADALLFIGDFSGAVLDDEGLGKNSPIGAMLVGIHWFSLRARGEQLLVAKDQFDMHTVWAGGDKTLEMLMHYVKADARADVPTKVGVTWGSQRKLAEIAGKVHGCMAVDVFGDGWPGLFLAAERGDRLFRRVGDAVALADVSRAIGLDTRSKHAAWGDFNGDGRLDLASCDDRKLVLRMMGTTGRLETDSSDAQLSHEGVSVAVFAPSPTGGARLLVATSAGPVVAALDTKDRLSLKPLEVPARLSTGRAGRCVVADFDGDGVADVVQVRTDGLLLFRGQRSGTFFEPTAASRFRLEDSVTTAECGDYDADGRLDLLVGGKGGCRLFVNLGDGKFRDTLFEAGEVEYNTGQSAVVAGANCDINNDGREDFVLFCASTWPYPFFNRGFRCFGFAVELNPMRYDLKAAKATGNGQQAGTVADFNSDGAQDMAVVTTGGHVWLLLRDAEQGSKLGATVGLSGDVFGPVNVIGYDGKRCLGARVVRPGSAALMGKRTKGPIRLQWKTPRGPQHTKQVIVLKSTRVTLRRSQ